MPGQGRYCHNSCYSGPGITCQGALAVKKSILDASKVPYQIEKTACNQLGCTALIRYSFANQADHDKYQVAGGRVEGEGGGLQPSSGLGVRRLCVQ